MKYPLNQHNHRYLEIFMTGLVDAFRRRHHDTWVLTIPLLQNDDPGDDETAAWLQLALRARGIELQLNPQEQALTEFKVECRNLSSGGSCSLILPFGDPAGCAVLAGRCEISLTTLILLKITARFIGSIKVIYKALVVDLDDTLWPGTLAEEGPERIKARLAGAEGRPYIRFMHCIAALAAELGIFIALCTHNDEALVTAFIDSLPASLFPLKGQTDCLTADFNDKSRSIARLAAELGITSDAVVFIDDNAVIRAEVRQNLPEVLVLDWQDHDDLLTLIQAGCLFDRPEWSLHARRRRASLKILKAARARSYLVDFKLQVSADPDGRESSRLYARSNQFKLNECLDFAPDSVSQIFACLLGDRAEICAAVTIKSTPRELIVCNWAISCRFFAIGLEERMLLYFWDIARGRRILLHYVPGESNLKVRELLARCGGMFRQQQDGSGQRMEFTPDAEDLRLLAGSTRLELGSV